MKVILSEGQPEVCEDCPLWKWDLAKLGEHGLRGIRPADEVPVKEGKCPGSEELDRGEILDHPSSMSSDKPLTWRALSCPKWLSEKEAVIAFSNGEAWIAQHYQ